MSSTPSQTATTPPGLTRRAALATGSLAALAMLAPSTYAWGQAGGDKLNLGLIGVGGRGGANMAGVRSENIIALCDTHPDPLNAALSRFPDARAYTDWRDMLENDALDGVVVSTADHHHALCSVAAMRKGLHVYSEKPLGHTPYEARVMQDVYNARRDNIATQMGTQIHATGNYRRVVELVQAGAIGNVTEAHVWCSRSINPVNPIVLPQQPIPEGLDWNAWLGPAPDRPYHTDYWQGGNLNWNRRWDFGNGVLGDMGSHLIDLAYWALELDRPTSVHSLGPDPHEHACPPWQQVAWEHPSRGDGPHQRPCKVVWYHGPEGMQRRSDTLQPMIGQDTDLGGWGIGVTFVGDTGKVLTADYGRYVLSPAAEFQGFAIPEQTLPDSPGHHAEWLRACKGQGNALCNFDYAGKLIEHNLLGSAAHRANAGKLDWDAEAFTFTNNPDADRYLTKTYRDGWELQTDAAQN
ncbi:MAG: Gfo/Idh/MocA family oxidoreductase [Phycisphaerales bacterium JB063]